MLKTEQLEMFPLFQHGDTVIQKSTKKVFRVCWGGEVMDGFYRVREYGTTNEYRNIHVTDLAKHWFP